MGGEPGRSDYESAEASLGRRRPQPTPRCQPRRLRGTDGRTDAAGRCRARRAPGRVGRARGRLLPGGRRRTAAPSVPLPRGGGREALAISSEPPRSGAGEPLGRAGPGGRCPRSRSSLTGEAGRGDRGVIHLGFAWKFPLSPSSSSPEPGSICSCDLHFFFFFSERERQTDGKWQPLIWGVILDGPCNLPRFVCR